MSSTSRKTAYYEEIISMKHPRIPTLFLHVPKTGGISLNRIMQEQYERNELYVLDNWRVRQSVQELLKSNELQQKSLAMISGHFQFGLHESLPYKFRYMTILRDPVSRILSLYFYILRNKGHNQHDRLTEEQLRHGNNEALRGFVFENQSAACSNAQVRQISGTRFGYQECTSDILALAKENIEKHFIAVGKQERYTTFVSNVSRILKWKDAKIYPFNKGNYQSGNIEQSLLNEIRELNRFDIELCEFIGDGKFSFQD